MPSIQALTFDVGYTLFDDRRLVRAALPPVHAWLARRGLQADRATFEARFFHFDRTMDDPAFSHTFGEPAIWQAVLDDLEMGHVSVEQLLEEYRSKIIARLEPASAEQAALAWAKDQGLRLGLITNERSRRINLFINHGGFRPCLDSVVISEERGFGKPDRRIFEASLGELGVPGEAAIHFGDNEITDGACRQVGMKFVLVTGYKDTEWTWGEGKAEEPDAIIERITPASLAETLQKLA